MGANLSNTILGGSAPPQQAPSIPYRSTYSPELEHRAKANGFGSAEQMVAWANQRNHPSGGTTSGQSRPSLDAFMSWHPAVMFNHILGAWQGATKDQ